MVMMEVMVDGRRKDGIAAPRRSSRGSSATTTSSSRRGKVWDTATAPAVVVVVVSVAAEEVGKHVVCWYAQLVDKSHRREKKMRQE